MVPHGFAMFCIDTIVFGDACPYERIAYAHGVRALPRRDDGDDNHGWHGGRMRFAPTRR